MVNNTTNDTNEIPGNVDAKAQLIIAIISGFLLILFIATVIVIYYRFRIRKTLRAANATSLEQLEDRNRARRNAF